MRPVIAKAILALDQPRRIVDPVASGVDHIAVAVLRKTKAAIHIVEHEPQILIHLPRPDGRCGDTVAIGLKLHRLPQRKAGLATGHILGVDGLQPHDTTDHARAVFERAHSAAQHLHLPEQERIGEELAAQIISSLG